MILVRGIEPNMKWRQFCAELLAACDDLGAELVVTMGALLADTPHTRPIPVTGTATEPELVDRLALEQSTYEGPTGILGVFNDACTQLDSDSPRGTLGDAGHPLWGSSATQWCRIPGAGWVERSWIVGRGLVNVTPPDFAGQGW